MLQIFKWYLDVLKKYAVFTGRARRKEYWYFALANGLLASPVTLFGTLIPASLGIFAIISALYALLIVVPFLAVSVRRLHDSGKAAWWLALTFIPYIGALIFIVLMCLPSDPGNNIYGPNPIQPTTP